jgi:hypothetical protein
MGKYSTITISSSSKKDTYIQSSNLFRTATLNSQLNSK